MSRATFIEVDGRRTRVRVDGDPERPPVLLVHGIGRSLEDWAPQYQRLSRAHRVIALDVPGFGFSERPRGAISLAAFARGVADTLDSLGESRPVHVVGNSLGGAIGAQLLAQQPDRVASLALINSAGFGSEVTPLLRMLAMPVIGPLSTRRTTRASATLFERTIFADRSLATKERVDHALAIGRRPDTGAVMLETAVELATGRGVRPVATGTGLRGGRQSPTDHDHVGHAGPSAARTPHRRGPSGVPARPSAPAVRCRAHAADRVPAAVR